MISLMIVFFLVAVFLSVTHTLWAYDVWWHLKTGEWIVTHHAIPRVDLYSFTVPDHPWIDLSWGFQVLLYFFYNTFGIPGIILFKASLVTLLFFLLFRFFEKRIPLILLFFILSLTLLTAHERLVERPEVISYLFLVLYLLILEKERRTPTKLLYVLPFLQILWANMHALFILGLLTIGTFFFGELLEWFSSRKKERRPFPFRLLSVLTMAIVLTAVNPYGVQGALFPFTLYTRISGELELFTLRIGEFSRPLAGHDPTLTLFLYKILLVLTPLSFLLNRNRFSYVHALLLILFSYLSLLARRNIAPFSFVCCFLLLTNLEGFLPKTSRRLQPILFSFLFLLPLPFVTHVFYAQEGSGKKFGLGLSEYRYPTEVAEFIEKNDLQGNFFSSGLEVGDYFIWHLFPKRKVFMDGRLEVYGASFFEDLFQLLNTPSLWPRWVEKYRINFSVLDHTNGRHDRLLLFLYRSKEWVPIYWDDRFILFLKKVPESQRLLKEKAIDLRNDPPPDLKDKGAELRLADFYAKIGLWDRTEFFYRKYLFPKRQNAAIYHNLGNVLRQQGKIEEAMASYQEAVRLSPKHYLFRYSLGKLYLDIGEKELAFSEFKKSARLLPSFGEAHFQLGRLYVERKWFSEAEKAFQKVRRSDPAYSPSQNALKALYAGQGEYEKTQKE